MHTRPRKEILSLTLSYSGQRSLSIYFYRYKDFVKERDSGALVLAKIINKKSGTLRYYAFVCVCAGALPGGAIAPSDSQKFLQYKPIGCTSFADMKKKKRKILYIKKTTLQGVY
jgi:hypothetical protein